MLSRLRRLRFWSRASRRVVSRRGQPLYNAFLSYSHEADGRLAPRLRSALHGFARSWNQVRALRIFVDNASLAADPGLWPAIEEALDDSEFLLLLASSHAAASRYVIKEVAHWLEHKPDGRILIVLTEGELVWDEAATDFDWSRTTALPVSLRGAFSAEPRWVDLRWARDAGTLSMREERFRDAVADLAATLHHRDKDELVGEDIRRHRRATRLFRGAAVALGALAVAATVAAVLFVRERDTARDQARIALSRQLAAQSRLSLDGQVDRALLLAVAAVRVRSTAEARSALFLALEREPRLIRSLWGEKETSGPAVFVPNTELVAAGDGSEVTLWSRSSGKRLRTLQSPLSGISGLSVSRDGRFLAGSGDNGLVVWDLRAPTAEGRMLPEEEVATVAFSPDGRLASAESDDSIRIWDATLAHSRVIAPARGRASVAGLAFDTTGRNLVAVARNGEARIWSTVRNRPSRTLAKLPAGEAPTAVAWGRDEIVAGTSRGRLAIWDLQRPGKVQLLGRQGGEIASVALSPDSGLAAAADGTSVGLWRLRDGRLLERFGTSRQPRSVAFSPDGAELATSDRRGSVSLWLWSRDALVPLARTLPAHEPIEALSFDPQGDMIAAGTRQGAVSVWDVRSGKSLPLPSPLGDEVWSLGFSPDGRVLAAGNLDGRVRVLDPRRGRDLRPAFSAGAAGIDSVAVDETGVVRAGGGHGMLWTWPADSASHPVPDSTVTALSPDGSVAAFAIDDRLVVWDTVRRRAILKRRLPPGVVVDVAFAPRGDAVAAAVTERVAVWSTRGGEQRAVFAPVADPSAGLIAVAVSDRARTIATGDSKGNVVVWDAVAGVPLGAPLELGPAFGALALSADGRRLAISGKPGVLLVPLDEGEWERAACRLANRGLDAEERRLAGGSSSAHGLDPCA